MYECGCGCVKIHQHSLIPTHLLAIFHIQRALYNPAQSTAEEDTKKKDVQN